MDVVVAREFQLRNPGRSRSSTIASIEEEETWRQLLESGAPMPHWQRIPRWACDLYSESLRISRLPSTGAPIYSDASAGYIEAVRARRVSRTERDRDSGRTLKDKLF